MKLLQYFRYMLYSQTESDPLESFLTRLLNDAVQQASEDIVKETVREMARDYVEVKHNEIVFDDLFQDYMDEVGPGVVCGIFSTFFISIKDKSCRNGEGLTRAYLTWKCKSFKIEDTIWFV